MGILKNIFNLIKVTLLSIALTIFLFIGFASTQFKIYYPVIDWILEKKGLGDLEGEEKGVATTSVVFGVFLPTIFFISLAIVLLLLKRFSKK